MRTIKFLVIASITLALTSSISAFAVAVPVVTRAELAANDLLDWAAAGDDGDNYFDALAQPVRTEAGVGEHLLGRGDDWLRRGRFVGSVASRGTGGLVKPRHNTNADNTPALATADSHEFQLVA